MISERDSEQTVKTKSTASDQGLQISWATPRENVSSGLCGERKSRPASASAQSDQGLHCMLTDFLILHNV